MRRLLLCLLVFLPLCLFIQDRYYGLEEHPGGYVGAPETNELAVDAKNQILTYPATNPAMAFPGNICWGGWVDVLNKDRLSGVALLRQEFLGAFAVAPSAGLPCALPWACLHQTGSHGLHYVLDNKPLTFLQMALDRYDSEVEGYSCILRKRERIGGKVQLLERVECHFLEKPFSVYMKWLEGARKCGACAYVEGTNDGKMWARGAGLLKIFVVQRGLHDADAKMTSRFTIDEFGIRWGTRRAQTSLRDAEKGALQFRYLGEHDIPEVGGRRCYKLHFKYDPPDPEGLADLTLYFDTATWLQIGSVLKEADGSLMAEYFFRDIKLNPKLSPKQFEREAI